jgi:hypothetical protein
MTVTRGPDIALPFISMTVGDSFFIPSVEIDGDMWWLKEEARLAKVKIECIQCIYNDMTGIRVWLRGRYAKK